MYYKVVIYVELYIKVSVKKSVLLSIFLYLQHLVFFSPEFVKIWTTSIVKFCLATCSLHRCCCYTSKCMSNTNKCMSNTYSIIICQLLFSLIRPWPLPCSLKGTLPRPLPPLSSHPFHPRAQGQKLIWVQTHPNYQYPNTGILKSFWIYTLLLP